MIIWVDAQLPPAIAPWMREQFGLQVLAVRDIGLRDAKDEEIFFAARKASAIVMSKDSDFLGLLDRHGPPPQVIWVTCGNTSNVRLREIFSTSMKQILTLLQAGESLVEIGDPLR